MTAIRGAKIPNGYRFEYDLMQDVRDRINRKIEIDGEKALELALAEVGYVKERTCKNTLPHDWGTFECDQCGGQYSVAPVYITAGGTPNDDPDQSCVNYCPNCGARVIGADE